jgi:hypothetical protein
MTSFIIVSQEKTKRQEYIRQYCAKLTIDPLDITTIEKDTAIKQNAQSIGIEEIKIMQKKLFLKPIKSPTKAIILEDAHLLTTEAQNALLKVLEEPPDHTIIILSSDSKETLLPTIISRCQIIELKTEQISISEKEHNELLSILQNLPAMPIGECLKNAETVSKDKTKATQWLEKSIILIREQIIELSPSKSREDKDSIKKFTQIIRVFQKTHTLLKTTNVNPRFLLENTFLSLNK